MTDILHEYTLPNYSDEVTKFLYDSYQNDLSVLENLEYTVINNKHKDFELCFKDNWNYPITNLCDDNICGTWAEKQAMSPYYKWLGERISLCLNINKGKSNEELKQIYESNQGTMA